jgi:hypothetical protein
MSEEVVSSMQRLGDALKRMTKEDAEKLAEAAAIRAEAVADYAEQIGRKPQ